MVFLSDSRKLNFKMNNLFLLMTQNEVDYVKSKCCSFNLNVFYKGYPNSPLQICWQKNPCYHVFQGEDLKTAESGTQNIECGPRTPYQIVDLLMSNLWVVHSAKLIFRFSTIVIIRWNDSTGWHQRVERQLVAGEGGEWAQQVSEGEAGSWTTLNQPKPSKLWRSSKKLSTWPGDSFW